MCMMLLQSCYDILAEGMSEHQYTITLARKRERAGSQQRGADTVPGFAPLENVKVPFT